MITINGKDNSVLVFDERENGYVDLDNNIGEIDIAINGNNNLIKFDDISLIKNLHISISEDNNVLTFGKYPARINCVYIFVGGGDCRCSIGDNVLIQPGVCISCIEPHAKLQIGNNVMIAGDAQIYAADAHPIIDINTGKVVNYGRGERILKIGDNCWIGVRAFISKNAVLPNGTIVGAQSFVSGHFEKPNTIIAGIPAKVIRENVEWCESWKDVELGDL